MTSTPILVAPNFMKAFILECDALEIGLGVLLMKYKHPIVFESWNLKPSEKKKYTYHK